ncbi:hypothetical protein [Wolbachia endosymbiont (group A) of Rhinocyllus conicus]|uniref:hypothetical protein n=1 Tax=Wolbachia endosymbiont (group A) of Rhinocyllus conicus TaxID=2954053 RepID=UPI002226ED74|nr:hypothetical protein [Wolbachia endosymbiont (group A) of Rhinocyllus conicus]
MFDLKISHKHFLPIRCHSTPLSSQHLLLSSQCVTLGWLCCIASYDGLKIKKMENISSLLFWYL